MRRGYSLSGGDGFRRICSRMLSDPGERADGRRNDGGDFPRSYSTTSQPHWESTNAQVFGMWRIQPYRVSFCFRMFASVWFPAAFKVYVFRSANEMEAFGKPAMWARAFLMFAGVRSATVLTSGTWGVSEIFKPPSSRSSRTSWVRAWMMVRGLSRSKLMYAS